MGTDTTSVPRWSSLPAPPDERGRYFDVVGIGPLAHDTVTPWIDELTARGLEHTLTLADVCDDALQQRFEARLAAARIGWRLLVAAPEHDAMVLFARARAAGAVDSEVSVHITDASTRRVHCAHCGRVDTVTTALGGGVDCAGCGRTLVVYRHFSRRLSAYLGFQMDAEQP